MMDTANAFIETFTVDGSPVGPLSGLTFGAKDLFDVAGRIAGCGNPEWARTHDRASSHALALAALLDAGGTLKGMTHTDELAYSLMGVNAHYGTPVNSADPRRVPGGSSSGSAAAVAAGIVDFGLGSDTGGSVRLPASFCGVWGIRTTFGQISLEGCMPFTHSFDTVGWFANSAGTMDRVAQAYHCPEHTPLTSLLMPVDIWARASAETIAVLAPSLARLEAAHGPAIPMKISSTDLDTWRETFRVAQASEIWDVHGAWVEAQDPEFGPGIKERFAIASKITTEEAQTAQKAKLRIAAQVRELLPANAALVLPTSPGPGPFLTATETALNDFRMAAFEMLCVAGLSGLPQLSVPSGQVDQGPVGLSLIGPKDSERALIAMAAPLETT